MRVTLWIVDDVEVLASFEKITLRRARRIAREWLRRGVPDTVVMVFSCGCTPPVVPLR